MSIFTFDQYLDDVGGAVQEFQKARDRLEALLSRHKSAAFSDLAAADFSGKTVTKAQYDAAMVTFNDLVNTWWTSGHGTNLEAYLTERPG
jgi:predicted negative regulator of RcsB-dependent stress response